MEHTGLERLVRLIGLLLGNKRTTEVLALMLECDRRTVQRYIQLLKTAGFLVEYHNRGIPFLSTRKGRLKDISDLVHFNEEEAFILRKAIDCISGDTLLKQNLKKKLYSIYHFPEVAEIVVKPELGETVHRLIEAMGEEKCVRLLDYHSAHSNTVADRIVEPYQFTTNYTQVWCFDLNDKRCKLFTTARIRETEVLETPWMFKAKHESAGLDVFRNSGLQTAGKVTMKLNIRAESLLSEEYPLAEKFIVHDEHHGLMFETEVFNFEGPARFVLGLYDNIEVLGDENFMEFLKQKISYMGQRPLPLAVAGTPAG